MLSVTPVGDDEELVAAEACDFVVRAECVDESPAACDQELVAHVLTEDLVDVCELVDVDEDRSDVAARMVGRAQGAGEVIEDGRPVDQAGQVVTGRAADQFGQLGLGLGDVLEQQRHVAGSGRGVDARAGAQHHLAAGERTVIDATVPRAVSPAEHVGGHLIEKRTQHPRRGAARLDVGERRHAEQIEHRSVQVPDGAIEAEQGHCGSVVVERPVHEPVGMNGTRGLGRPRRWEWRRRERRWEWRTHRVAVPNELAVPMATVPMTSSISAAGVPSASSSCWPTAKTVSTNVPVVPGSGHGPV